MRLKLAAVCSALVCVLMGGCGGSSGGGGGTVTPTITSVTVTMAASTLATGSTDQATATVTGTGAYSSSVTWSVTPSTAGTISIAGVFSPSAAGSVTVTATSVEDSTKSGTSTVTVTQGPKIVVTPATPTVTVGTSTQFTATVSGEGANTGVTWSVVDSTGNTNDAGTITSAGLYQSPFPAPATVTVTATSTADTSLSASTTVTLAAPATAAGPVLTVDAGVATPNPINPWVYGMNAYVLDTASATLSGTTLTRWGGDDTERYNYLNNDTNSASDYYFENGSGAGSMLPNSTTSTNFTGPDSYLSAAIALPGVTVLGTTPQIGWVAKDGNASSCGYPQATFPGQVSYAPNNCGNGVYPMGTQGCTQAGGCPITITGNAALTTEAELTSVAKPVPATTAGGLPTPADWTTSWATNTFVGQWVNSIVTTAGYGTGKSGKGVAIWDLGNEPAWWDAVQRDVHGAPSTYDEVTYSGISTALAIKKVDSTALVAGPIIDYWWNYFYSKQDIEQGWGSQPCYQQWDNPTDREAHGGVPMIEWYLQQMKAAETTYGTRLLDIVDIHGYFAGSYNGNSVAFTTAGDTGEQAVREDSVRSLWDPNYKNSNYPQPNYSTDPGYSTNCNAIPLQAPQAIPMLKTWVANDYPGTMTAIDEYNWGGLESINGAVTQADVLGVFGQYGLDMGSFWPTTNYSQQGPVNYSFAMYRNYDLKNDGKVFGDKSLPSCSTTAALTTACVPISGTTVNPAVESGQGQLSVYGALRSTDNAITVMVINKTWGPLTSTLSLLNVTTPGTVTAYQYSNASLTTITPITTGFTVTPPTSPSTTSTLTYTYPGQSITLFVIPQ